MTEKDRLTQLRRARETYLEAKRVHDALLARETALLLKRFHVASLEAFVRTLRRAHLPDEALPDLQKIRSKHLRLAPKILADLRAGDRPVTVMRRYGLSKTYVYRMADRVRNETA